MTNITFPIHVDLPDNWVDQIINRLRNDPDADWVEIIRCRDCKFYTPLNRETKSGICSLLIHQNFGWH